MSNSELKNKFNTDFKIIQNIVNDFDICGLINSGAPKDEYENITSILLSGIYNKISETELVYSLKNEMENFGAKVCENGKLNVELEKLIRKTKIVVENKPSH